MARNPIQFGKGLSLTEFQEHYGTEEQCRRAVIAWRWPSGFVCPACGCRDHAIVGKRRLYLCHGCRRQTSVIAGTVFENSLLRSREPLAYEKFVKARRLKVSCRRSMPLRFNPAQKEASCNARYSSAGRYALQHWPTDLAITNLQ